MNLAQQLKEYSQEDVALATASGMVMISDTKIGLITIEYKKEQYNEWVATNSANEILKIAMRVENMEEWLAKQYDVVAE